jgi:hypothetical protein
MSTTCQTICLHRKITPGSQSMVISVVAGLDHNRSKNGVASLAYATPIRGAVRP